MTDEATEFVLDQAANDPALTDDAFVMVSRALRGLDPLTGGPAVDAPVPVPLVVEDDSAYGDEFSIECSDRYGREVVFDGRPLFADPAKLRRIAADLLVRADWLDVTWDGGSDE